MMNQLKGKMMNDTPCRAPEKTMVEKYHEEQRNRMALKPLVAEAPKALDTQVGGDHYKTMKIQPVEYIHRNGIGFCEGSIIKYVSRWRGKNGLQDLKKARHFLDLLIEMESGETK